MKLVLSFLFGCIVFHWSQAQTKQMDVVSKVEIVNGKTVVQLKWFPSDYAVFSQLIKEGATLERVEIQSNNVPGINGFEGPIIATLEPAKKRLSTLDKSETSQKITALLEPFLADKPQENEETKNFAFALAILECSISKEMGEIAGCTYTDVTVEKGKNYAYRIRIKNAQSGFITVQTDEATSYPKLESLSLALDRKNTVEMRWQSRLTKAFGYGFLLEKSLDVPVEGTFLTQTPYVPVRSADEKADKDDSYRDEQLTEGHTHYYRLVGLNYFGEPVLFSEWKEIYVPNHVHASIYIDTTYASGQTRVIKTKALGVGKPMNIKQYKLLQSTKQDADYSVIETKAYQDSTVSFTVQMPKTGDQFYYKVLAISDDFDTVSSLPSYVFTLDQEAPEMPTLIAGKIDSIGIVRLSWQAPKDNDLLGYRIYRANDKREEFKERNTELSLSTTFVDTLRLDNLTSEVYYCLKAVDKNYNNSPFSDTILLLKPDTIAPVAALLSIPILKDSVAILQWNNSPSTDISINYLIREETAKQDTLIRWTIETNMFEDRNIEAGNRYSYRIVTMDKSHNTSASPARQVYYEPGYRPSLKAAKANVNRTLKLVEITWSLPKELVFSFQIYKSVNNEPLSLLKTIENGTVTSFQDKDVRLGNTYHYTVKYILKSGIHGLPTEVLQVIY